MYPKGMEVANLEWAFWCLQEPTREVDHTTVNARLRYPWVLTREIQWLSSVNRYLGCEWG